MIIINRCVNKNILKYLGKMLAPAAPQYRSPGPDNNTNVVCWQRTGVIS